MIVAAVSRQMWTRRGGGQAQSRLASTLLLGLPEAFSLEWAVYNPPTSALWKVVAEFGVHYLIPGLCKVGGAKTNNDKTVKQ